MPQSKLMVPILSLIIYEQFKNKNKTGKNTITIIRELCKTISKLPQFKDNEDRVQQTVSILREISKGPDGIVGTDDDLIDQETCKELGILGSNTMLEDIVYLFSQKRTTCFGGWFLCYKYC